MSDDKSHSGNGSSNRGWFEKIALLFQGEPQNREDLVSVIQDAEERDLINPQTKEMIEGVMKVVDMRVRDIMIPRSQMITVGIDQTIDELLPIILTKSHSRFPVINEDKDHIEGVLLAKDLLPYAFSQSTKQFFLKDVLREAIIVPEGKRVDSLLSEFRQRRYHMAIVVDEYGGVSGLVTIEDILEEIVGDIVDEYDVIESESSDIRQVGKYHYTLQALTPLEDFNTRFNADFNEDDADTIGGILLRAFGHMPERGETIEIEGFTFKILNADSRRIQQVQLTTPKPNGSTEEANLA